VHLKQHFGIRVPGFLSAGRGGPIVTVGVALLFIYFAIMGERPVANASVEAPKTKEIGAMERVAWAALAGLLLAYEYFKLKAWAQHPF